MQWKGKVPGQQVVNDPIISLDIYATLSELTGGLTLPETKSWMGLSLTTSAKEKHL